MGELTTEERAEVIRALKEQRPGAGPCSDLEMFFRTKPLTLHFYALIVRGALTDSRKATDTFLRSLPKELFEMLVVTLGDFLKTNEDQDYAEAQKRGSDFIGALILLIVTEKRKDRHVDLAVETFDGTEAEPLTFANRLAKLASIETLRRVGVVKWVDRYTLLRPVTEKQPRRSMTNKQAN